MKNLEQIIRKLKLCFCIQQLGHVVIVKSLGIRDVIFRLVHFCLAQLASLASQFVIQVRQLSQEPVVGPENYFVRLF